jgi:hypothetical protein
MWAGSAVTGRVRQPVAPPSNCCLTRTTPAPAQSSTTSRPSSTPPRAPTAPSSPPAAWADSTSKTFPSPTTTAPPPTASSWPTAPAKRSERAKTTTVGVLTLRHVERYHAALASAGIRTDRLAPMLLPDYTSAESKIRSRAIVPIGQPAPLTCANCALRIAQSGLSPRLHPCGCAAALLAYRARLEVAPLAQLAEQVTLNH